MAANRSGFPQEEPTAMNETYRLKAATLAIRKKGKSGPIVIPSGATLTASTPVTEKREGIVACVWGGIDVLILTIDLRERGARVDSVS